MAMNQNSLETGVGGYRPRAINMADMADMPMPGAKPKAAKKPAPKKPAPSLPPFLKAPAKGKPGKGGKGKTGKKC